MAPPPLLGFNNNVRHRGRVFHIQTEDSGVRHARIVTHLFADGGRIVGTRRLDYTSYLGQAGMTAELRRLMKEQHKAMFLALRAGELDEEIGRIFPEPPPLTSEQPPRDTILSMPVAMEQATDPEGTDGLASLRVPVCEPVRPDTSSAAPTSLPSEPSLPDAASFSIPANLEAALTHAAGGAPLLRAESAAPPRRESDAGTETRSVSTEGTRRSPVFGGPSLFGDVQGIEDSLGDAILTYIAEDGEQREG